MVSDRAINYAFQQNAIPIIKELRVRNSGTGTKKALVLRITTEPEFALPAEIHLQELGPGAEFRDAPIDLRLSPEFLGKLNEKVSGHLRAEILQKGNNGEPEKTIHTLVQGVDLLARNEWCGLASLPEILAAFVLPNDPAIMPLLGRAAEILRANTGRADLNAYQDKNRKRAWEQVAAIYKAISELNLRYIVPPASFEDTGQKIRFPSDAVLQRFATCLDLTLLFAACCEQAGLRPLILMHEGHAYGGCWLEERTLVEPSLDDLQHIRKLFTDGLITVFELTTLTTDRPGTLVDSERAAKAHLQTEVPFRVAVDVHRSRIARIHPLPIPGQMPSDTASATADATSDDTGIGLRDIAEAIAIDAEATPRTGNRIDQWKSKLLDLSLRNKLINFKPTKSTIPILSSSPEHIEDELAANVELALHPKPKLMDENDPRNAITYTRQQRADALAEHLRDELVHRRLRTGLQDSEHSLRLTELFRAARLALDENGTNTLYLAVGILEWRETEHSDRTLRSPILLVPVELKRKSVLEGFSLRRIDEETRLNVTLMEMLRQEFNKEIPGLDPLPGDDSGVDVRRVFQLFRESVRDLIGWEVKSEVWLGQFSFTKFLLWKDLADRLEALTQNRVVSHLVHDAGCQYPNPEGDIRPVELDERFHPREIYCPRSADSSQLSAVLCAAAGHDLVLEGPPGTGKSQTIANIISDCLARGKRILFVAEKRAALDVVHRRLREEGLAPFCLELHSNKSGKTEVLAQFEQSLKFVEDSVVTTWEARANELEKARKELNDYVRILHFRYACGLSAFDCLDYLLPRKDESMVRLDWSPILETSSDTLIHARETAHLLHERSKDLLPLAEHPLAPIGHAEWSPSWADRCTDQMPLLKTSTQEAAAAARDVRNWLGLPVAAISLHDLHNTAVLGESLLNPQPVGPAFALTPWRELGANLDEWIRLTLERSDLRQASLPIFGGETTEQDDQRTSRLPCEEWTHEKLENAVSILRELLDLALSASQSAVDLRNYLPLPIPHCNRGTLVQHVILADCLIAPHPVSAPFVTCNWEELVPSLNLWIDLSEERHILRERLTDYNEKKLLSIDLVLLQEQWNSRQGAWFLLKSLRTVQVRRTLATARPDRKSPDITSITDVLAAALRLRAVNEQLSVSSAIGTQHLGAVWAGGQPDPDALKQAKSWGSALHSSMRNCAGEIPDSISALKTAVSKLFEDGLEIETKTVIAKALSTFREQVTLFDAHFGSLDKEIGWSRERLDLAPDHITAVAKAGEILVRQLPRLRTINGKLREDAPMAEDCLGLLWNKGEPMVAALEQARTWGELLHARMVACASDDLAALNQIRQLLRTLFAEGTAVYGPGTRIHERLGKFIRSLKQFSAEFDELTTTMQLDRVHLEQASDYLSAVVGMIERFQAAWTKVRLWCSWQKARREAIHLRMAPVVSQLESAERYQIDLAALFEGSFRRALLSAIFEKETVLRDFFGHEHVDRIERFRKLDDKMAKLTRNLIRARLAAGIPRDTVKDDLPKEELGLLRKELGKKTRHIPVRQLLSSIPNLLPRVKPCVLMSPLSVAQYLEASHELFDVVIFDEASQIPVWDAVGAIARGKQLIVVGDPKQLPPTNFFSTTDEDEGESSDPNIQDLESILDELLTVGMRHKRLRWHYRSRHEGLIAFSNRHYYENDLLTFPSPHTDRGGVRFKHLPDGRYDKGKSRTNIIEARALVEELVRRLRSEDGAKQSFGVVTFSQAQQNLIEDLLDEERRKFPEIEIHFGDEPPVVGETVFVKNLENVQGDERDVIFFSICYGPDESGRVSMNFGPMNRDGGERRLNVAITRAKEEVLVFSTLRGDQIDLTRTRSRGARDLKFFLEYAERGPKAFAEQVSGADSGESESEFERLVADRIRGAGYDVHHQVGCSGYRIDLAVVDPTAPGRYLVGIECDGATYHRAATARDRDKLRQAVLEDLGWKIHRIWSTDWWHDPDSEMKRLHAVLDE